MDIKQLRATIRLMKKEGVTKLRLDGLELELDHSAIVPRGTNKKRNSQMQDAVTEALADENEFTPEQILMWSAPGLDISEGVQ